MFPVGNPDKELKAESESFLHHLMTDDDHLPTLLQHDGPAVAGVHPLRKLLQDLY